MDAILQSAFQRFGAACAQMGSPAWRVDHVRREFIAPEDKAIQAFASCPGVIEKIAAIACRFDESPEETIVAPLVPGAWVLLVRERVRSRRFAWVATLAPTSGALAAGDLCALGPELSGLKGSLACALHRSAVGDFVQAEARASLLADLHHYLATSAIDERSIDEFTSQLSLSYESATMLHRVGELMSDITRPRHFIERIVEELYRSSEFAWVAFARPNDAQLDQSDVPFVQVQCDGKRFEPAAVEATAQALLTHAPQSSEPFIMEHPVGVPAEMGPEIVVVACMDGGSVIGMLALGARTGSEWAVSSHDTLPIQAVAASVAAYLRIVRLYRLQHESFLGTLSAFSAALDAKDRYTQGHSERVAAVARLIAEAAEFDAETCELVFTAGLVHDIGKIGVPEAVLCGVGRMTDEEFAVLKRHPEIGERILRGVPLLASALPGVLHHHERWDGNGYPSRLKGESIPLLARILAIADTFDAMSSTRSYRAAIDRQAVLDEIRQCSGKQFDPDLVDAFFRIDLAAYDAMLVEAERIAQQPPGQARAA